MPKVPTSFRL